METIIIKRHITNEVIKDLGEYDVKKIVIQKFYDHHGNTIDMGEDSYNNSHIKIQHRSYREFERNWQEYVVTIDGKRIRDEVVSFKGDTNRLVLRACVGAG